MEFELITRIPAPPEKVYKAWLSSEGHTLMTGGVAKITDHKGEKFTAWDGYIWGKNLQLDPNKRIVQSWRTSEFNEEDPDSEIEVIFSEAGGETELRLIHRNLSEDGVHYKKGWDVHYFVPMKEYFKK